MAEWNGVEIVIDKVADIGRGVLSGVRVSRVQAMELAVAAGEEPFELFYWACRVRTGRFANAVKLCSIAPGKLGGCSEDCKWCAQSTAGCTPKPATRTRPELVDLCKAARAAATNGAGSFGIVNSGRRPSGKDLQAVIDVSQEIADDEAVPVSLCASLGELTPDEAARLFSAGVRTYNHNLETSRRHFPNVVTTHTYDDRLETLRAVKSAGMRICCGGIFGIGESWEDRIDLALTLRDEVRADVVPLNFLHPIPGTPLGGAQPLRPMEILGIIAVYRLILPEADLKVAGGREVNLRDLQSWMFHVGATSCLIGNYLTTPGRDAGDDLRMIADLGLKVVANLPQAR